MKNTIQNHNQKVRRHLQEGENISLSRLGGFGTTGGLGAGPRVRFFNRNECFSSFVCGLIAEPVDMSGSLASLASEGDSLFAVGQITCPHIFKLSGQSYKKN